ncbi:MAG: prepilin-type N-terminal cleavage/methylation domain-containing protein [Methylococcales bacterium]
MKRQAGLSLVELMIGLLVGAVVVAGALKVFTGSAKNSTDNINVSMLNQDLRVMMDIMARDIRRAGYMLAPAVTMTIPFSPTSTDASAFLNKIRYNPYVNIATENSGSCITYLYNKTPPNPAGVKTSERLGFKLDGNVLRMRRTATSLACGSGNWESITSPEVVITQLQFSLQETLLNIFNPASTAVIVGDQYLIIRNVIISLTGALKDDAGVTQTLTETVRVRNNQYCKIGGIAPRTCV